MSEQRIKGPSAEDLELMAVARKRLAERLGGHFALSEVVATPEPDPIQVTQIIAQAEMRVSHASDEQRMIELGLLAETGVREKSPYFAG